MAGSPLSSRHELLQDTLGHLNKAQELIELSRKAILLIMGGDIADPDTGTKADEIKESVLLEMTLRVQRELYYLHHEMLTYDLYRYPPEKEGEKEKGTLGHGE